MKILLVDDHKLVRAGLALVLKDMNKDLELLESGTGHGGIELANSNTNLDLVLMDLDLPEGTGLEALAAIHQSQPSLPVVILSAMEDATMIAQAMALGARGFIPKTLSGDDMIGALQLVLSGGTFLPENYEPATGHGDGAGPSKSNVAPLTQRQLEVLRLMAQGASNKKIARELKISENTVRVHISAIISALGANNRTEAAYSATKMGLVPRVNTALS